MSLSLAANAFSFVFLHHQVHPQTHVAAVKVASVDRLAQVTTIKRIASHAASRSYERPALHERHAQRLPRVTCWNGTVVVEHPHVQDCPKAPAPKTAAPAPTTASSGIPAVWQALVQCEAGGNWAANTGNGFYGGPQFTLGTWRAYGGSGLPSSAPPAVQLAIARKVLAAQGVGAWPICGPRAGLYPGA